MADRAVSDGANGRALDGSLAETGAGLADEAVVPGELEPGELGRGSDAAVEALKRKGWIEPAETPPPPANKG